MYAGQKLLLITYLQTYLCFYTHLPKAHTHINHIKQISMGQTGRASKTFVLFVLCTEAETGYFGGRHTVKGEDSQYSLTEALWLFWVPPWGLHLSPVANIHIIDRVLYCRMAFLSPTHNWKLTLKMIRGIRKILFKLILYFFQVFSTYFVHLFYNMYEIIYVEIMVMPRLKRRRILFWKK